MTNSIFIVIWNIIKSVEISDILDIAIIAFLIFKIITFVRKTNSTNIIKGIAILVFVLILSSAMHLRVVNYLLSSAFEIGVLAVIVLFQPELRRILEQLGQSYLVGLFDRRMDKKAVESTINQIVLSCSDMSKTRTGALIVFERNNNLDSYIRSGTMVNADVASELIKNIFYDKAPLHDGAIIIRDGRIAGAACMLPLSGNTSLSRDIGMRHRAAVGISERTDCVVAIVSEETGAISVAVDGMLKRDLTVDTFEMILRNELTEAETQDTKKTKFPFFNIGDKQ